MSILLDESKLDAIRRAVESAGSQSAFARRAGITKQHVSKYLRGDVRSIEYETWFKMLPYLQSFLEQQENTGILSELQSTWQHDQFPKAAVFPSVITTAAAAGFDCTLEPFDVFAERVNSARAPLLTQGDGFTVLLTGLADKPYPPGTWVYVNCREYPRHGDRVAARLKKGGSVCFLDFFRENDKYKLIPPGGGHSFVWKTPEENPWAWIYPVRYALYIESASGKNVRT